MTVIKLGNVHLQIGMTRAEAEYNDEKIKQANHGKTPIDRNGKELQSNISLFKQYDTNRNGVIDESEYKNYREDIKKKFEEMNKNSNKDIEDIWNAFVNGKLHRQNTKYAL